MNNNDNKVVVISGASKGIGAECARRFASGGFSVYNLSRTPSGFAGVTDVVCDVTSEDAVEAALRTVMENEGRIDVVIANAGYGISGAVEFTGDAEAKSQFDVNFFGAFHLVKAAMKYLKETRGRVLAVSSAAAVFSIPFQSFYSASKSALAALMRATAGEVKRFGVSAGYVQLGDVKTSFTSSRVKDHRGDDVYGGSITRSVARMERDEQNGMEPSVIANSIFRIATKRRMPLATTVGVKYKLLVGLSKILPLQFQNYVIGKMYIK